MKVGGGGKELPSQGGGTEQKLRGVIGGHPCADAVVHSCQLQGTNTLIEIYNGKHDCEKGQ